jgi:hypothetical protein
MISNEKFREQFAGMLDILNTGTYINKNVEKPISNKEFDNIKSKIDKTEETIDWWQLVHEKVSVEALCNTDFFNKEGVPITYQKLGMEAEVWQIFCDYVRKRQFDDRWDARAIALIGVEKFRIEDDEYQSVFDSDQKVRETMIEIISIIPSMNIRFLQKDDSDNSQQLSLWFSVKYGTLNLSDEESQKEKILFLQRLGNYNLCCNKLYELNEQWRIDNKR